MSLEISTVLPDISGLILKGDEESILSLKKILEIKSHLFITFGDIKDIGESKEMQINFPTATREAVKMILIDFCC
ncbi:MAG: hypothetical protein WC928_00005 [Patescibacteria group bacterium]|jgi:hypothetical protein